MHSVIFFTKFDFHNSAFESLFSQIIRVWKLFWLVVTYFSCKLLCLQWEFALALNIEQVTTNMENLEKCQFLTKSGKTWKSQGKILKMVFRLLVFWKFFLSQWKSYIKPIIFSFDQFNMNSMFANSTLFTINKIYQIFYALSYGWKGLSERLRVYY